MQTVLCSQLPAAFAGRQAVAQRQSRVPTVTAAAHPRCVVARAGDREAQSLTGEWSANWSLASCELQGGQLRLALANLFDRS